MTVLNMKRGELRPINKKGFEMTITLIVIIVLSIIVLVILVLGFSMGWNAFWAKLIGLTPGSSVDNARQACETDAASQSRFAYCCEIKEAEFVKGQKTKFTCNSDERFNVETLQFNCENILELCSDVVCADEDIKTECELGQRQDTSRALNSTGFPLDSNQKCCVLIENE